jgi:hypothetical protein
MAGQTRPQRISQCSTGPEAALPSFKTMLPERVQYYDARATLWFHQELESRRYGAMRLRQTRRQAASGSAPAGTAMIPVAPRR